MAPLEMTYHLGRSHFRKNTKIEYGHKESLQQSATILKNQFRQSTFDSYLDMVNMFLIEIIPVILLIHFP